MELSDLLDFASEKINYGHQLLQTLGDFQHLEGIQKLERKIKQEVHFLNKIVASQDVKKEHLQCSNLTHFSALIRTLGQVKDCVSVCKPFAFNDRKLVVDVVCNGGLAWIKVIARNPKSLSQISVGDTGFGVRSVVDQAKEFLECSKLHPRLFQTPEITFVFANGIENHLALKLESLGIIVQGNRINDELTATDSNSEGQLSKTTNIDRINLDVSAMLAYVSSVTNGSCTKYKFSVPVLAQQAEWESKRPVKPILDDYFEGKKLYCCETAKNSFVEILSTVGGPTEKIRGEEFLQRISVLPDNATARDIEESNPFTNVQFTQDKTLPVGGKIRERSLIIFTFGDRIQAVTVTANEGFVRAAKQQDINFAVFIHESRALTEQKESKAALL